MVVILVEWVIVFVCDPFFKQLPFKFWIDALNFPQLDFATSSKRQLHSMWVHEDLHTQH